MLVKFLIVLIGILVLAAAVAAAVFAYSLVPLSDHVNRLLRKIGLAGPSPQSRAAGVRSSGTVDSAFLVAEGRDHGVGTVLVHGEIWNARCAAEIARELQTGEAVEVLYNDDLTVTVLRHVERPRAG